MSKEFTDNTTTPVFTGGKFRLMNMGFMRLAVLKDGNYDTRLTVRVPNLHDEEVQGDLVGRDR